MNENKHSIKQGTYEGYLWYSDQKAPEVYDSQNPLKELQLDDISNPFVVEGQLFDADSKTSYSIKYVDGRYLIGKYDTADSVVCKTECYLGKRMGGKVLQFREYWEEVPDDCCCGMGVLKLDKVVFVGFKK